MIPDSNQMSMSEIDIKPQYWIPCFWNPWA